MHTGENIDIALLCDGVDHCTNGDDETTTLCESKPCMQEDITIINYKLSNV